MKKNNISVSVMCLVYNHGKYLNQCLRSLVNQKTNFDYEILVHDDCSTDNSREIIEKLHKEYPEKIIPIYENENQYSKGVKISKDILVPMIQGKYFCFCEGDDFWIDENKIQKQFDFLENNLEYKFCVHNSIRVNKEGIKIGEIISRKTSGELSCEDFILNDGDFIATNSIFSYTYLVKKLPKYFDILSIDFVWQIYLSSQGKTYCFKEPMSAYRVQSNGSWTSRMLLNPDQHIIHKKRVIDMLKCFDLETNNKYHNQIIEAIIKVEYEILVLKRDYKLIRSEKYIKIYKKKTFKTKLKYFLDEHFPMLYKKLKQLRSKL